MSWLDEQSDTLTEDGRRHDEEQARARAEEPARSPRVRWNTGDEVLDLWAKEWVVYVHSLGEYSLYMRVRREPYLRRFAGPPIDLTEPLADRPELRVAWIAELESWVAAHRTLEKSDDELDVAIYRCAVRALEILGKAPAGSPRPASDVGTETPKTDARPAGAPTLGLELNLRPPVDTTPAEEIGLAHDATSHRCGSCGAEPGESCRQLRVKAPKPIRGVHSGRACASCRKAA